MNNYYGYEESLLPKHGYFLKESDALILRKTLMNAYWEIDASLYTHLHKMGKSTSLNGHRAKEMKDRMASIQWALSIIESREYPIILKELPQSGETHFFTPSQETLQHAALPVEKYMDWKSAFNNP